MAKRSETPSAPRERWLPAIRRLLEGRTIVEARYMNVIEVDQEMWPCASVQLKLDDGTLVRVSRDDEGNGPGALLFLKPPKMTRDVLPICPVR